MVDIIPGMALNIKNQEVERLAEEIASLTGESKTEVIRKSLQERRRRLSSHVVCQDRESRLRNFLEHEIWPSIPDDVRGKPISRDEWERILGFSSEGV
jgi:antitoxin VapB